MEANNAATPKSSGAKIRVIIGATSTPNPCATTLPVKSFKTFPAKLFENLIMAALNYAT
jgi:hypothetical protein